jgi:hypothetical protein
MSLLQYTNNPLQASNFCWFKFEINEILYRKCRCLQVKRYLQVIVSVVFCLRALLKNFFSNNSCIAKRQTKSLPYVSDH